MPSQSKHHSLTHSPLTYILILTHSLALTYLFALTYLSINSPFTYIHLDYSLFTTHHSLHTYLLTLILTHSLALTYLSINILIY